MFWAGWNDLAGRIWPAECSLDIPALITFSRPYLVKFIFTLTHFGCAQTLSYIWNKSIVSRSLASNENCCFSYFVQRIFESVWRNKQEWKTIDKKQLALHCFHKIYSFHKEIIYRSVVLPEETTPSDKVFGVKPMNAPLVTCLDFFGAKPMNPPFVTCLDFWSYPFAESNGLIK